ncbi:MAG: S-methyl-5-thioribose-1-phosphate isomerase [Archangiaceae bacterium]|nr:S-methyl-5-thioribose-1-phosphate isomerase [Archangiaceae bacterium]
MKALREAANGRAIEVIDQTKLPFALEWLTLSTASEVAHAIKSMIVRGAPLIGVAAGYGLAMEAGAYELLKETRPTAVNLKWALDKVRAATDKWAAARAIAAGESEACRRIGELGRPLLEKAKRGETLRVLTHCNAGWLATGDWGTALAPIYAAKAAGTKVHVWVDETRPRNQGALTAWELADGGVPHRLIVDNAGGLLMLRGEVDVCIVGADRIARNGDVCNKVGTYLKALAAHDNGIPFYVAAPESTIDRSLASGSLIPIEERSGDEVRGWHGARLLPETTPVGNPAFDVTPAKLVTGIITEHGVLAPAEIAR